MTHEQIIALRKRLNLSQEQLARRLGVTQPTVWRMEDGQAPSGPILLLLQHLDAENPPNEPSNSDQEHTKRINDAKHVQAQATEKAGEASA